MVIRAYYVLDGQPGVEGLVPTLRDVPETAGCRPCSDGDPARVPRSSADYAALDGDPRRHAPARLLDP